MIIDVKYFRWEYKVYSVDNDKSVCGHKETDNS